MDGLFGIDPEQLKALMAQFGASPEDTQAANKQAAMALGFGLLGGRKGDELATLGRAGFGAMGARQASLTNSGQMRQQGLQNALGMAKLAQAAQAQQQAAAQSQEMAGAFQGGPQLQNMGPGGPTPENAAAVAGPSMVEQYRKASVIAATHGNSEAAKRYADIANQMEAEYSTTPQTMKDPSGNLASVLIGKRGETKKLDYLPAEKLHFADTGSSVLGLNQYTGRPESPALPKTMTPGETASNQVALGHLGLARNADARAAAAVGQGGKPQWDSTAGMFVYPPTPENPAGKVAAPDGYQKMEKPLTESQAKATAFANQMSNATKVLDELSAKGFSGKGLAQQGAINAAGAEGLPYLPGSAAIPRMMAGDQAQKFDQAKMQWTEAALRFMTGANAPESEVRRNAATYFPLTGDSEAKLAQKAEMRAAMEQSIRMATGAGAKKLPEMPQPRGASGGWSITERK